MLHYTCDLCKRSISASGLRYSVKIEVSAAFDPQDEDEEGDDRDHLLEIQEILEQMDDDQHVGVGDDVHQELHFDLCPDCRRRFAKDPLGRDFSKQFDFSKN